MYNFNEGHVGHDKIGRFGKKNDKTFCNKDRLYVTFSYLIMEERRETLIDFNSF